MPRDAALLEKRNKYIRERYRHHKTKNPKWRSVEWVNEVANEVFLSPVTVSKILFGEGEKNIPDPRTINRNNMVAVAP